MRILRFLNQDGQVMLGEDSQDGKATVLFDGQGIFGPRQDMQAARALLHGLHAIIADDDEIICHTISRTLEKFDCRCTICRDGAEAIKAIHDLEFDLVVSDIVMPHHNGYEIFASTKQLDRDRPVVLITGFGYDPGHAVVKATNEGLEEVLYKPFTPTQLIEKIASAIRTSKNGWDNALTRSSECVKVGQILAPAAVGDVICVGRNYPQHEGTELSMSDELELFMKPRSSLLNPTESIQVPDTIDGPPQLDCEGELAVIIGKDAKCVIEDEAMEYVLGMTAANDVTAKKWQNSKSPMAWMRGKGFDTFCPVGPAVVTPDEVDLVKGLNIATFINDRVVRQGNTSQMIRSVPRLISEISQRITLRAGTLLLTGSPSPLPEASDLVGSLKSGDEVCIEIEGIGRLVNKVSD